MFKINSLFKDLVSALSGKDAVTRDQLGPDEPDNSPGRSLVANNTDTGFLVDADRAALVSYTIGIAATSSIGSNAGGQVLLEISDDNAADAGHWTAIASVRNSQVYTLSLGIQGVLTEEFTLSRIIPAGKFVRLRKISTVTGGGSVSYTIPYQQEALLSL